MLLFSAHNAAAETKPNRAASFADFDKRARNGERLSVVFFGASLTWGANASDPLLTSYRALISQRLEAKYPRAHFKFHDGAIGGTTSQLGAFRLDRDALRHKPDLLFLDFSANDDIYSADEETLSSYEALVRRVIVEARCSVVQVIFPFKWNIQFNKPDELPRRVAHLAIARHYNVPSGDVIALAYERVQNKTITLDEIWPYDGSHPADKGYVLFADAAWNAFQNAVQKKTVCTAPAKMLHATTYLKSNRARFALMGNLPRGWKKAAPDPVGAYFDMVPSRWLEELVVASNRTAGKDAEGKDIRVPVEVEPLRLTFRGSAILLFGESTPKSANFRVTLDGKVIEHIPWGAKASVDFYDAGEFARKLGNNAYLVTNLAQGLDVKVEHTLEIMPLFEADKEQEFKLESLLVAGGTAPGAVMLAAKTP